MRKRIYEIIEVSKDGDIISTIYDVFMMVVIIVSIIPLAFVNVEYAAFDIIDKVSVIIFIIDYILRIIVADLKMKKGWRSFLVYPITPMALLDLISILPSLSLLNSGWRLLKVFRLLRSFRVFRVFKAVRYSKSIDIFIRVFKKQKTSLLTILCVALFYVLVSALVVLNVEPQTFGNYYRAFYWAVVSLTTMGYGDIYPTTIQGQFITMLSSILGIAIIAMPSGIITAGYIEELQAEKKDKE